MGIISGPGSFAVQFGDHLRSGIICGPGIIGGPVQYPFHIPTLENCTPFLSAYNEVKEQYYWKKNQALSEEMLSKRQVFFIHFTL